MASRDTENGARLDRRRLLFAAAALVTLAWFGLLGYWWSSATHPIVVSRPQVLSAPVLVEGRLLANPARIRLDRVWWGDVAAGQTELALIEPPADSPPDRTYFFPLESTGDGRFRVHRAPREPGAKEIPPAWIYPATQSVREQMEQLSPGNAY